MNPTAAAGSKPGNFCVPATSVTTKVFNATTNAGVAAGGCTGTTW